MVPVVVPSLPTRARASSRQLPSVLLHFSGNREVALITGRGRKPGKRWRDISSSTRCVVDAQRWLRKSGYGGGGGRRGGARQSSQEGVGLRRRRVLLTWWMSSAILGRSSLPAAVTTSTPPPPRFPLPPAATIHRIHSAPHRVRRTSLCPLVPSDIRAAYPA